MSHRLKLLVSALIVAVILGTVDVGGAIGLLVTIDPLFVLGTLALFLLGQFVEACKLRILLPDRRVGELFALTMLVQLYALVLPGQLAGEAVKTYRLCRGRADSGAIVSAAVFDKVTGLIALLLLTLGAVALEAHRFGTAMVEVVGLCLLAFLAGTALLAAERPQLMLLGILERLGRRPGTIGRAARLLAPLGRFLDVWRLYVRRPRVVGLSLALGVVVQVLAVLAAWLLALGLGIELGFPLWCVVFGVMSVVVLVPVTVGGLGLREASLLGLLAMLGVPHDRALALALAILGFKIVAALLGALLDVGVLGKGVPEDDAAAADRR